VWQTDRRTDILRAKHRPICCPALKSIDLRQAKTEMISIIPFYTYRRIHYSDWRSSDYVMFVWLSFVHSILERGRKLLLTLVNGGVNVFVRSNTQYTLHTADADATQLSSWVASAWRRLSAGLCTTRAMRPHRAVNFRRPPFSRQLDTAGFTALSCS